MSISNPFKLPGTAAASRAFGYTGEQCPDCGQLTVKQGGNKLYTYLACDWCMSRFDSRLIEAEAV